MPADAASRVAGADGCRGGGWVVAVYDGALQWDWAADTAALLAMPFAALAMDVPIGLPALGGVRQCDVVARGRVAARRSSVFAAPPREVLGCATYAEARPLAPSLSAQAFGLVPLIRCADRVASAERWSYSWSDLTSRNSSRPYSPSSRPLPLCL